MPSLTPRREVEAEAAAEPVLSSFLHAAVVGQPSLTAAVAWVLAHRLDGWDSGGLDPVRRLATPDRC